MRGLAWMGLPAPQELLDTTIFVRESPERASQRQQRQIDVFANIDARGVGKAAFDAAGGWKLLPDAPVYDKRFVKACAEWADGELVCAHVGYQNDILCTNDCAVNAGASIFDPQNRKWLTDHYGVAFRKIDELAAEIAE